MQVNPTITQLLERKSYATISEVHEDVDIVHIFRKLDDVPPVVDAIKKRDP